LTRLLPASPIKPCDYTSVFDSRESKSLDSSRYSYKLSAVGQFGIDAVINEKPDFDESRMSLYIPIADGKNRDGVGDLLQVEGIRTNRHIKNPIILYDHGKQTSMPIALAEDPQTKAYTFEADTISQTARVNAFFYQGNGGNQTIDRRQEYDHALLCQQLYDLAIKRFLRSGSIGYQIIHAKQLPPDYETGLPQGLHLLAILMLEGSLVVLPANQDTTRKSFPHAFGLPSLDNAAREVLCMGKCCGKPLSPMLVKSLEPYAGERKAQMGYEAKHSCGCKGDCKCGVGTKAHGFECTTKHRSWVLEYQTATIGRYHTEREMEAGYAMAVSSGLNEDYLSYAEESTPRGQFFSFRPRKNIKSIRNKYRAKLVAGKIPVIANWLRSQGIQARESTHGVVAKRPSSMTDEDFQGMVRGIPSYVETRPIFYGDTADIVVKGIGREEQDKYRSIETGDSPYPKKALNLRQKYRSTKGLRHRMKKSSAGTSIVHVHNKDIAKAKTLAEGKGLKFHHLGTHPNGNERVKLMGDDSAIDEVAKAYGKPIRRKGLEDISDSNIRSIAERIIPHLGPTPVAIDYYVGEVGGSRGNVKLALETLARLGIARSESNVAYGTLYGKKGIANKTLKPSSAVKIGDLVLWNKRDHRVTEILPWGTGVELKTEDNQTIRLTQADKVEVKEIKSMANMKTKALPDEETPPPAEEAVEEETPEIEAEGEEVEPYGAQVLRRIHEHHMILMEEYDEMRSVLENEEVGKFLDGVLEGLETTLTTAEGIFEHEYEELEGLEGAMDTEDEGEETEGADEKAVESDSEEEELPTGDEVVEGMEKAKENEKEEKSLRNSMMRTKRLQYRVKSQPSDKVSPKKAEQILKEGEANGKPLTDKQRGMFGAAAGKGKRLSIKDIEVAKEKFLRVKKYEGKEDEKEKEKFLVRKGFYKDFPCLDKETSQVNVTKPTSPNSKLKLGKEPMQQHTESLVKTKDFPEMDKQDEAEEVTEPNNPPVHKDLEPHHKKAVAEASDHLHELSGLQNIEDEHRMKSYHFHKSLEGVAEELQGHYETKDFPEMAKEIDEVNVEKPTSPTDSKLGKEPMQQFGKDFPELSKEDSEVDLTKPTSPTKVNPGKEPMQQYEGGFVKDMTGGVHPHVKPITEASHFLKETSEMHPHNWGEEHRTKALLHHKALNPIGSEVEEGFEASGEMGEKALKALKASFVLQNKEMAKLHESLKKLAV